MTHSFPTRRSSDLARLGPGIGVEQIGEGERPVGDAPQHLKRITVLDADIAERRMLPMIAGDMDERLCDAVDEGFGADEAMVGQHVGARRPMLAAAEADFEMQRAVVTAQLLAGLT